MSKFEIVAHRGVPAGVPENTIAAYRQALDLGADGIELDVRLSEDQAPVVFHNFYLDEPTNASGPVFAHKLAQLREVTLLGGRVEAPEECRIPTFREVLEAFAGRLGLEIEIKGPEPESAKILSRELEPFRNLWDTMEVTSYEPALLLEVGQRCPGLATDLIQRPSAEWMRLDVIAYVAVHTARLAGARGVHLHPTQLSSEVVETVRAAGLEVHSGFANDVDTLRVMDQLGILKFDTDNVRLAIEYREGLAR